MLQFQPRSVLLYYALMAGMRPVLVAAAPLVWTEGLVRRIVDAEPLLAADGGADHLARLGIRPRAVIGDLDSLSEATRCWLGDGVLRHRPDQERTDLDKALEYALEGLGLSELTVIGALGGRPDHDLSNLGALARLARGDRLRFEGDNYRIVAVTGTAVLPAEIGETWSFWTFDPGTQVSLEGVRWAVHSEPLAACSRPSISNRAVAERVTVHAVDGAVVVCRHTVNVRR